MIDAVHPDLFEQDVRSQVAAAHDHQARQFKNGLHLPKPRVESLFRIILNVQRERTSIGNAGKRVDDGQLIRQGKHPFLCLAEYLHHDMDFESAGGMECFVRVPKILCARFEIIQGDAN